MMSALAIKVHCHYWLSSSHPSGERTAAPMCMDRPEPVSETLSAWYCAQQACMTLQLTAPPIFLAVVSCPPLIYHIQPTTPPPPPPPRPPRTPPCAHQSRSSISSAFVWAHNTT